MKIIKQTADLWEGAFPGRVIFVIFCILIFRPSYGDACGWWGDGEASDDYDVIWVEAGGTPPDDESLITDPRIQTKMGNRYATGKEGAVNYEKAAYWYRKAAEQGFAGAQNNLAALYEQGLGFQKDDAEAAQWYRRAAEWNDAKAQHSLGVMYRDGRGIPRDLGEAVKLIRKSAEQGHHGAFRDMGNLYWNGTGVSQNNVLACMWWKLSAMHGDKESSRLLSMAAEKMEPGRMKEAERLAREKMQNQFKN